MAKSERSKLIRSEVIRHISSRKRCSYKVAAHILACASQKKQKIWKEAAAKVLGI